MSATLTVGTQYKTQEEAQERVEQFARTCGFAAIKVSRRSAPYRMKFLCKCHGKYRSTRKLPENVGEIVSGQTRKREARSGKLGCNWMVALRFARKPGQWEICSTNLVHNHSMDRYNGLSFHENRLDVLVAPQAVFSQPEGNIDMLQQILKSPSRPLQKSEMIYRSLGVTMLTSDVVNHSQPAKIAKSSSVMKLLHELPDRGYIYSLLIDANAVLGIFIIRRNIISEARRMGQLILVDATYKTNDHRLPLVNIVGVNSNRSTFRIAVCYLVRETELYYGWMWDMLSMLCNFTRIILLLTHC
ncbi:hypothetical protein V1517DRAFT_100086 [Lipomyces orientalis]|uniref:Uncharacterized protein n=1 Tax=Lipomyces orientalis TaxID=1233043 RepID=A0ACC3TC74_9ASCO